MSNMLEAKIQLINDGVKFRSVVKGKPEVITDYIPPFGDGLSLLPLELFLVSLATCVGGAILPLLKRMRKQVGDLKIDVVGTRRTEHPTCFEGITLKIVLTSTDATEEDLKNAMELSEAQICPVWAMIKGNVKVSYELSVIR
jgi:putative redox protein